MTDLYFTHDGDEAEMRADVAAIKEMLADAKLLRRYTVDGEDVIGDPDNVLGPARGSLALEIDDGEGGKTYIPAKGVPGRWYLILRTNLSLDKLEEATGLSRANSVGDVITLGKRVRLHLPPADPDDSGWAGLKREFAEVLGVWA